MPGPAEQAIARLRRRRTKLEQELAEIDRAISALQAAADLEKALSSGHQAVTTDTGAPTSMHDMLRQKYSDSAGRKDARVALFLATCRANGIVSMRDAAKAVDLNQGYISQCLRGKAMPWATAKRIEDAVGYAATPENWPNLGPKPAG